MASNPPGKCCTVGVLHEGTPSGKTIKVGGKYDAYLATPPAGKAHDGVGLVYLSDVLGLWQNSYLMADQLAANGYLTLVVDLFNGDALTLNQVAQTKTSEFDFMGWLTKGTTGDNPHTTEAIDPIVVEAIKTLIEDYDIKKIGALGYCFGAKYVVRHSKNGIDAGFLAHPSFVEEEELAEFQAPLAIAAAETDSIFPAEKRHRSEVILKEAGHPYQINLYSGVTHGFAVRCDLSKKADKYAKEQAFLQAVTWFDEHLL